MKQDVIQNFLNLPGIAGVAFMGKRSRPYFYGIDQTLNFQQKEALSQGILQVFETIPDGFESFRFHFAGYQVYIYKLDRGIILLVLTRDNLIYSDYLKTIKNLKAALREDITNAIATFRLFAGSATLSSADHRQTITSSQRSSVRTNPIDRNRPPAQPPQPSVVSTLSQSAAASLPIHPPTSPPSNPPLPASPVLSGSLNEAIVALNQLSKFTTQYLGTHVIANYWKSTRPDQDWLKYFQVDRSAQMSFADATPQQLQSELTPEQKAWIQEWVAAFIGRCSRVIRNFSTIIGQKGLSDEHKSLLLG